MSFKKLVLKNTTAMSLNERFTYLRGNHENTLRAIRENNALQHQASAKNRRLAQQMERRPAVMAALKLKKRSLRQRLGQPQVSSVKERLSLPIASPRGSLRGRGRGRGTLRGRGMGGRSFNELGDSFRFRRGQGRSFGTRRPFRRGTSSPRGVRGSRFNRGSGMSTQRGGGLNSQRGGGLNAQRGGGRGGTQRGQGGSFRRGGRSSRGGMRGRGGRRGGRGGRQQNVVPSKEELDLQLDQYMANTKSHLDKELDSYMNQAQPESWD